MPLEERDTAGRRKKVLPEGRRRHRRKDKACHPHVLILDFREKVF